MTSSRGGETLSLRLRTLHSYHRNESSIWDIGCDHGLLGLSFSEKEGVSEIHLVDPSELVIKQLKHNIDSYITKSNLLISIHHEKGEALSVTTSSNLFLIAGMGGKTIKDILEHLKTQPHVSRVVISPHKNILDLRRYLEESAYRLEDEVVVFEEGRFYQVLALTLDQSQPRVSRYGLKLWQGSVGEAYRQQQIDTFMSHRDSFSLDYLAHLRGLTR